MKEVFVYADWQKLKGPYLMGILKAELLRGKEVFSFSYSKPWLDTGMAQQLDPDLKLFTGPQFINDDKPNFGLFLDSSPDRWGRVLMKRRETIKARNAARRQHPFLESDFLLGVNDQTRMGALRFKLDPDGPFLDEGHEMPTPPIHKIRELEQASLRYEDDNFIDDPIAKKWLDLLFAPASSLGGARPKANVVDLEGNLLIAKFPSKNDERDSGAWEYICRQMAVDFGIRMAKCDAQIYSRDQHTFLTRRFDRSGSSRLHFASAMTLLGYKDGYNHAHGGSYLDLVELIEQYGADPTADIRELWKRIVFSVAVSNTDDHLRNHGFLLNPEKGWKLSPAYDINPIPDGYGLSLNIDEDDNSLSLDLCLKVHSYFRWKEVEAEKEIERAKGICHSWETRARQMKLKRNEIESVRPAFEKAF
jgi:serine/threonine-protein kinase HipA